MSLGNIGQMADFLGGNVALTGGGCYSICPATCCRPNRARFMLAYLAAIDFGANHVWTMRGATALDQRQMIARCPAACAFQPVWLDKLDCHDKNLS
jgi:hypothetical protein